MATPNPNLIYRSGSNEPLTFDQLDGNFAYLSQSIANITTPESSSYALTASYVETAQTASYFNGTVENATTASYVDAANVDGTVTSASYALTASYALSGGSGGNIDTSSLATTGSNTFTDSQTIVGNVTFPSSSFISTTDESGSLFFSALNEGTLFLNADGGEGDVQVGYNGWTHKMDVRGPIQVTNIQGTGSLYLKPDESDVAERQFEIYNTAPSDIHFKGSATHSFFGDDTNYLKIDDIAATVTIDSTNGLFINSNTTISGDTEFSGSILVSGSLIPNTDGVSSTSSFSLGSPTNAWKDIYVSNGTINFLDGAGNVQSTIGTGNNQLTGDTSINGKLSQGTNVTASGTGSHAEGTGSKALSVASHAEGWNTCAGGTLSGINANHAEGRQTTASARYSHAEGYLTYTVGEASHAEGYNTFTQGSAPGSHAEGDSTRTEGAYAHAEGTGSIAWSNWSHAEGIKTNTHDPNDMIQTQGQPALGSHAEGEETITVGRASHAEGYQSYASGSHSHAEGYQTFTEGIASHAAGNNTFALGDYQNVAGQFNTYGDSTSLFIIGNGADNANRSDAFKVRMSGSIVLPTTQSAAPSWTGVNGEMVFATVTGNHYFYVWMAGAWRSGSLA
jgi:hypothetical protein